MGHCCALKSHCSLPLVADISDCRAPKIHSLNHCSLPLLPDMSDFSFLQSDRWMTFDHECMCADLLPK